ncbi:MAG: transposase [Muribaculaceae bacterium]
MKFFDKKLHASIHWRNLPHWSQGDAVQFITFRLADSLPQSKLEEYAKIRKQIYYEQNNEVRKAIQQQVLDRLDYWLDQGYGSQYLGDPKIRQIVADAMHHWDGERYQLLAYVIMPNHLHILLIPAHGDDIYSTFQSIKRYTAVKINKYLQRSGSIWENDMFDYMPRNYDEFNNQLNYIIDNPNKLCKSSYTLWLRPSEEQNDV